MSETKQVSWKSYAQKYDMLLSYNPFYQELHEFVITKTGQWHIQPEDQIADIGAGTGNYSIRMAQQFPTARILHIDSDLGMNARCKEKIKSLGIKNHQILAQSVDDVPLGQESLKALISIHALYTFKDPIKSLQKMYDWLQPGGKAILVDAGRVINILSWQFAISRHLISTYGWRKTFEIFREGREVSKQNAFLRNMQKKGILWTHSHAEFCQAVASVGFEIRESGLTFRGVSDWVVVVKPDGNPT